MIGLSKLGRRASRPQWQSSAFEREVEDVLADIRFYLELDASERIPAFDVLLTARGRPECLDDFKSAVAKHEDVALVDLMRGWLISVLGRRLGPMLVLGSQRALDLDFAAYRSRHETVVIGSTSAAAEAAGRLRTSAEVRAFYLDQAWELTRFLRFNPTVVVIDADGARPDLLRRIAAFDAPAGYFLCGSAASIHKLLEPSEGILSECAGIRSFSASACPPGTAAIHVPRDAVARVADGTTPKGLEPTRYLGKRTYCFPTSRRLINIADGSFLLTEEHAKRVAPPTFIGGTVPDLDEAVRVHTGAQVVAPRHALEFHDLRVVGDGICFTKDDYFFDGYYFDRRNPEDLMRFGGTYWNVSLERSHRASARCGRADTIDRVVSGRSFVMTAPNAVFELFAHFALDFMPRVQLAIEHRQPGDRLFVSSHIRDRQKQAMIDVFGLQRDEIQIYERDGGATLFEHAILIPGAYKLESATSDNADAYSRASARAVFPSRLDKARCKKIFTSRRDTQYSNPRLLLNLDEVAACLAQRGFVEIVMSEFSFAEQMAIFRNADVIVGELGSSMQPIGACRRGVKLVWIFGERAVEYYTYFIAHYSSSLDASYAMVGCEQFGWAYNSHFLVDLDVLNSALDSLGVTL